MTTALDAGKSVDSIDISLSISSIKPLHAKWVKAAMDQLASDPGIISDGFLKAGLNFES